MARPLGRTGAEEDPRNQPSSVHPEEYEPIPWNPEGTVGIAAGDGSYDSTSSSLAIQQSALTYLSRAGLKVAPMPMKGMGSAAEILWAIGTGLAADVIVHIWKSARAVLRSWSDRKSDRKLNRHRVRCSVQLGDKRGTARDAVELLILLPGLRNHLDAEYPNRDFWFVIFSATSTIDFVQIILTDYDDLRRTVRQMAKIILRMPKSNLISLTLQDGPFGSRRVTFNVV